MNKIYFYLLCFIALVAGANAQNLPKITKESPPDLQYVLAKLYEDKDNVKIDGLDITQDFNKAFYWYNLASQGGYIPAKIAIARFNIFGMGIEKNTERGKFILYSLAEEGDVEAMVSFVKYSLNGDLGEKNITLILKYLNELAGRKVIDANGLLAKLYYEGLHVETNYKLAREHADISFANAEPVGSFIYGMMYARAIGPTIVPELAFSALSRAASSGIVQAQVILGLLYYNGSRLRSDLSRAYIWLSIAQKNGDKNTNIILNRIVQTITDRRDLDKLLNDTIKRVPSVLVKS